MVSGRCRIYTASLSTCLSRGSFMLEASSVWVQITTQHKTARPGDRPSSHVICSEQNGPSPGRTVRRAYCNNPKDFEGEGVLGENGPFQGK